MGVHNLKKTNNEGFQIFPKSKFKVIWLTGNHVRDISRGIRSRQKSGRVGSRSRSGWPIPIFQQIGIGSGWPIPTFQQIGIGSRSLSSNFRDKIGENRDFPRVFPSFLGQKHREKSGKIEESQVTSRLFPILSKKSGKVGISPTFPDLP